MEKDLGQFKIYIVPSTVLNNTFTTPLPCIIHPAAKSQPCYYSLSSVVKPGKAVHDGAEQNQHGQTESVSANTQQAGPTFRLCHSRSFQSSAGNAS
jgi:hypothetical protein